MRLYRFNDDLDTDKVKDALSFNDTFALCEITDLANQVSSDNYKTLKHCVSSEFDYVCLWQSEAFPVRDVETRTARSVREAYHLRGMSSLVFPCNSDLLSI